MTTPILVDPSAFKTYYLGTPGAMQAIRTPNQAVQQAVERGEVLHQLISGGNAVTHRLRGRRAWQLSWAGCTPDTADQLIGFYLGVFGDGPFRFVDPSWRNALSTTASTFGNQLDAVSEWTTSSSGSTVSFDTTVTAPNPNSGVARWSNTPVNGQFAIGSWDGSKFVPDPVATPPYLPPVVAAVSVFARSVSGTPSVSLRARTIAADGTTVGTTTTTATVNSSGWTPLTAVAAAGQAAAYVIPNLLSNTANAIFQFACPLVQYGKSPPNPWVIGLGVPAVVIPSGMAADYDLLYARDHGLTLAEI